VDHSRAIQGYLAHGGTLVVDELDASLHPQLTARLIQMFHDPSANTEAAQLVFSTHDTSLLGSIAGEPPLHRDELWLTEKDAAGATRLFPATDFHPRKHENLERGYLQGRYGAVPVLGVGVLRVSEPGPV
jgi:AAA15 family ATPase/GTPase